MTEPRLMVHEAFNMDLLLFCLHELTHMARGGKNEPFPSIF